MRSRHFGMTLRIISLEIIHQPLALGNHFQKAAARTVVLSVFLEMLGKALNFRTKKRDLHFRRSGISVVNGTGRNNFAFLLGRKHGTYDIIDLMNVQDLKSDFLEYLEIEKNRSPKTVQNYDHYLSRVLKFLEAKDPGDMTEEGVRKF